MQLGVGHPHLQTVVNPPATQILRNPRIALPLAGPRRAVPTVPVRCRLPDSARRKLRHDTGGLLNPIHRSHPPRRRGEASAQRTPVRHNR